MSFQFGNIDMTQTNRYCIVASTGALDASCVSTPQCHAISSRTQGYSNNLGFLWDDNISSVKDLPQMAQMVICQSRRCIVRHRSR